MSHWTERHTKKNIVEHYEAEIARLQAEVERLRDPDWIRFNDAALEAFSMMLDFPHGEVDLSEGDRPEDFRGNFIALVRSIRDTAWNDAIDAAAKWCEENGMAIRLKEKGPYAGYVTFPVGGLNAGRHEGMGYAAVLRALRRPT